MSDILPDLRFYGAKRKWPKGLHVMPYLLTTAADEITRLRTSLSEAEQQVQDARLQTQAMHRRAQESERVEQMIFDTLGTWFRLYNEGRFKPRAKRALFFVVLKELKARAEKIRGRRALIPSEPHDAEVKPSWQDPSIFGDAEGRN